MAGSMSDIFAKLSDLKSIFQFAEKIVPIIQNLIEFMQEMTPLLENINSSITDSTNQIKRGTVQISDVTNATEMATTEILDLVDEISNSLIEIENDVRVLSEHFSKKNILLEKLLPYLNENKDALAIVDEIRTIETENLFESLATKLAKVNEDSYKITLSLQVQDITAQQLASVNHLIESVQSRLSSLISEIDQTNIADQVTTLQGKFPAGVTFDPNATYTKTEGRQEQVDSIIKQQKEITSQDEIDKLFSK